jgi:HEAT repeat protein
MSRQTTLWAGSLLVAYAIARPTQAAEPKLPRDGWVSWEVTAVEEAPAWCCFGSWQSRDFDRAACKLDGKSNGYGTRHDETTETVKVYARSTAGKLDRLQVLSANCPVETKTPVQPLGDVSIDDSTRWLINQVKQAGLDASSREPLGEAALAALAMHRGDPARDALAGFARDDSRSETRKRSVFWLSQLRGTEGADITSAVMFNDKNSDVREHAAFALSQSKAPRVAPDLIKLGNTDKDGEVRAKAWFWLAQNGAPQAEAAIATALRKDTDDNVREQAVFALSQLPDERAARALIAAAEDTSLSREQRKRAVFWLSQSESDAAIAYLDKVLTKSTSL